MVAKIAGAVVLYLAAGVWILGALVGTGDSEVKDSPVLAALVVLVWPLWFMMGWGMSFGRRMTKSEEKDKS